MPIDQSSIEEVQLRLVKIRFSEGLRVKDLGDQPAPWMRRGLEILESGEELTLERVQRINIAGGTDHPDPWF